MDLPLSDWVSVSHSTEPSDWSGLSRRWRTEVFLDVCEYHGDVLTLVLTGSSLFVVLARWVFLLEVRVTVPSTLTSILPSSDFYLFYCT